MSWLFESSLPILVLGSLTVVIFGAIWLQTGKKQVLYALIAIVVLTVTSVIVERLVETDREEVDATLRQIAREVERNDAQAAVRHVHSSQPAVRDRALVEMQRWRFEQVSIKQNLQITVFRDEDPPRAVTEFNVTVIVSDQSGLIKGRRIPRFARVTFLQEDGQWRVSDYSHDDPQRGYQQQGTGASP